MNDAFLVAERKVKGGKLVRVKVKVAGDALAEVRIEGDFFVHPEEFLGRMERALVGMAIVKLSQDGRATLEELVRKEGATLLGFGIGDVVDLLEEACSGTAGV